MTHEFDTIHTMAQALRGVFDLTERSRRAAAYIGAGIDPGDIARLDRAALAAETARRTLFPQTPPAGKPAAAGVENR